MFSLFFSYIFYNMQDGVMETHDEETRRFFKRSSVQVLLCPRSAGKKHSLAKQQVFFLSFSQMNVLLYFACCSSLMLLL